MMNVANARSGERRRLPAGEGAPCPCRSGFAYRICHQPVVEAPPEARLDVARRAYARSWAVNAAAYETQGLYARLARHLASHRPGPRLVDLGCGRGDGMAAMRRELRGEIIGVDENPACLAAAAARLGLAIPAQRLQAIAPANDGYGLVYRGGDLPVLFGDMLVQSDLLRSDEVLAASLQAVDAVTLWFPGTHKAREHDRFVRALRLITDEHYAVAVELAAIGFAGRHLKPAGLLQIVDRGAHCDARLVERAFHGRFATMAASTGLALIDLKLMPYAEPSGDREIAVKALALRQGEAPTLAISAIFRRG